jgi:hypothetical protein
MFKMQVENMETIGNIINSRDAYKQMMDILNKKRSDEGLLIVGGTHFKQERKKMSSSNYTLSKILNECIDNVCYKCNNVSIYCTLKTNGYLQWFSISDDDKLGFVDISYLLDQLNSKKLEKILKGIASISLMMRFDSLDFVGVLKKCVGKSLLFHGIEISGQNNNSIENDTFSFKSSNCIYKSEFI